MPDENFAARLKELREAKGWSQGELAEHAGLTAAGVANLEQGRTGPVWASVLALARALGVSCEAFTVAPATPPEPRRRGRPRKPPAVAPPADAPPTPPKRPRGRRRG